MNNDSQDDDSPAHWYRIDKTALTVVDLDDPPHEARYWRTRPVSKRLEVIEYLRWITNGQAATTGRLQRVLEIADRA